MNIILLYLSVRLAASQTSQCPQFRCANLTENICMSWVGNSISLNANGCESNFICSFSKAMIAYSLNEASGSYLCEASTRYTSTTGYTYCGTRLTSQKNLKTGTFPKTCSTLGLSDPACANEDGSNSKCTCGLNSYLYCQPVPSSSVYNTFWSTCESSGSVVDAEFFQYYATMYEYYVEYNTGANSTAGVECSLKLFKELSIASGKAPTYSYSVVIYATLAYLVV